jgi:DNA polymerase III subunit alpha
VFTLDDRSGRIEASIFEEAFAPYRTMIVKGAILIVEGSLRFDEFIEGWRLQVKRAIDINQAREQHARRLLLRFPSDVDGRFLSNLERTLAPFRGGKCAIAVHYQSAVAQAEMTLSQEWCVKPSREMTEALTQLLGQDSVKLVYAQREG